MIKRSLILFVVMVFSIASVSAADVSTLSTSNATDWTIWILSGLIWLFLFLYSLNPPTSQANAEIDAIVSGISIIPALFCGIVSFNVERIVGTGVITLYSFPIIGILMIVAFVISIGNTFRIISTFKLFKIETTSTNTANRPQRGEGPDQESYEQDRKTFQKNI